MNPGNLVGRTLKSVWFSVQGEPLHPAWVNESTPLLVGAFVNFALAETSAVQVVPCEVQFDPNRYPALGIDFAEISHEPDVFHWPDGIIPAQQVAEIQGHLPARIKEVRLWDSVGEGPNSAVSLLLDSGVIVTARFVQPMLLGLEVAQPQTVAC